MSKNKRPNHQKISPVIPGAAIGIGATAATLAETQDHTPDHSHLLIKDQPINEIPIILSHNANTYTGSGTIHTLSNQQLTITDTLNKTPTRGFELDLYKHDGDYIVNHADGESGTAIVDPFTSNPVTLDKSISEIDGWLSKPENADEVIIVKLSHNFGEQGSRTQENYEDMMAANDIIASHFGNKIYTPEEQQIFYQEHGRWPTIEEMSGNGNQVIIMTTKEGVISDEYLSNGDTLGAFTQEQLEQSFQLYGGENRSAGGTFIRGLDIDYTPENINTEDFDKMVEDGGIISLDQITEHDPRFVHPDKRDELIWDPDITIGGEHIYIADKHASSALMGVGTSIAVGAGSFTIANSISKAFENENFIKSTPKNLRSIIQNISREDLEKESLEFNNENINKYAKKELKSQIRDNTLQPGIFGTLAVATSILLAGVLFPAFFGEFSIAAFGTLGLGLSSTMISSKVNQDRVNTLAEKALEQDEFQELVNNKTSELKANKPNSLAGEASQSKNNNLANTSKTLLGVGLATRISSLAKYTVPSVGIAAVSAISALSAIGIIIGSMVNYKQRQKAYESPEQNVKNILEKHSSNDYEEFISNNKSEICKKINIDHNTKTSKVILELGNNHPAISKEYMRQFQKQNVTKKLDNFAKKNGTTLNRENCPDILRKYIKKESGESARKDTLSSGITNSLFLSLSIFSLGTVFSAVSGIITLMSLSTMVVGTATTAVLASRERTKFQKQMNDIDKTNPNIDFYFNGITSQLFENIKKTTHNQEKNLHYFIDKYPSKKEKFSTHAERLTNERELSKPLLHKR